MQPHLSLWVGSTWGRKVRKLVSVWGRSSFVFQQRSEEFTVDLEHVVIELWLWLVKYRMRNENMRKDGHRCEWEEYIFWLLGKFKPLE